MDNASGMFLGDMMSLGGSAGDSAFDILCQVSRELSDALEQQGLLERYEESGESLHAYWNPSAFDGQNRHRSRPEDIRAHWRSIASEIAKRVGGKFPLPE
ncbi:MAG TPA: hypothetical protein VLB83_01655 [Candidatus Paceibacterota bacterium]|nr:hypothetical protein [Candidatus Paceibacterota bacterium]